MWEKSVGHRLFKKLPLDPADKRVASIIALDSDPVDVLYGARARQELSPGRQPGETGALELPALGAGEASEPGLESDGAPSALSDSLADEPGPAEEVDELARLGATHPPGGKRTGDTLAQIVDEALAGNNESRRWLTFALGFDGWQGTQFDRTLRAYLRARLPILLDLAEEGRA